MIPNRRDQIMSQLIGVIAFACVPLRSSYASYNEFTKVSITFLASLRLIPFGFAGVREVCL